MSSNETLSKDTPSLILTLNPEPKQQQSGADAPGEGDWNGLIRRISEGTLQHNTGKNKNLPDAICLTGVQSGPQLFWAQGFGKISHCAVWSVEWAWEQSFYIKSIFWELSKMKTNVL